MDDAPARSLFDDAPSERTRYAYGLGSRVWAVSVIAIASANSENASRMANGVNCQTL